MLQQLEKVIHRLIEFNRFAINHRVHVPAMAMAMTTAITMAIAMAMEIDTAMAIIYSSYMIYGRAVPLQRTSKCADTLG